MRELSRLDVTWKIFHWRIRIRYSFVTYEAQEIGWFLGELSLNSLNRSRGEKARRWNPVQRFRL
jgi:hypothetical protein